MPSASVCARRYRLRIAPQFSGRALRYVPWHFIHHGPLQLLVRPTPSIGRDDNGLYLVHPG